MIFSSPFKTSDYPHHHITSYMQLAYLTQKENAALFRLRSRTSYVGIPMFKSFTAVSSFFYCYTFRSPSMVHCRVHDHMIGTDLCFLSVRTCHRPFVYPLYLL